MSKHGKERRTDLSCKPERFFYKSHRPEYVDSLESELWILWVHFTGISKDIESFLGLLTPFLGLGTHLLGLEMNTVWLR